MKLTVNQLRRIIKEEISRMLVEGEKTMTTGEAILRGFEQFMSERSELTELPEVAQAMEQQDYRIDYDDIGKVNQLILGTIIDGGGDALYDALGGDGIEELEQFLGEYVEAHAKPLKKPRIIKVIPYSEYRFNEDEFGEEL